MLVLACSVQELYSICGGRFHLCPFHLFALEYKLFEERLCMLFLMDYTELLSRYNGKALCIKEANSHYLVSYNGFYVQLLSQFYKIFFFLRSSSDL